MSLAMTISSSILLMMLTDNAEALEGGEPSENSQFSYMAALWNIQGWVVYDGTIISKFHILTAAHCIHQKEKKSFFLTEGEVDLNKARSRNTRSVKRFHIHTKYIPPNVTIIRDPDIPGFAIPFVISRPQHDIGIVELDVPFDSSEVTVSEIAHHLPTPCDSCIFAGWGSTSTGGRPFSDILMYTYLSPIDPGIAALQGFIPSEGIFYASEFFGEAFGCPGDSWDHLVCNGLLSGVLSTGHCNPGPYFGFANVADYLPFITFILELP